MDPQTQPFIGLGMHFDMQEHKAVGKDSAPAPDSRYL